MTIKDKVEMLRFLADENFNNQIVRGILRQRSDIDIVRVQDVDLSETDDRGVFEISRSVPIGLTIEEIILITEGSFEGEWEGQVQDFPLRQSPSTIALK